MPEAPRPTAGLLALAGLVAACSLMALALAPDDPAQRTYFLEVLAAPGQPGSTTLEVLRRALAAPWVHGDPGHLAGNLVGLLLLGAFVGPGALRLVAVGALAGTVAQTAAGQATLGLSGGVYALAGHLAAGRAGTTARVLGAAYLALGFLGGMGAPGSDALSHGLGAAVGMAAGGWVVAATRPRALPLLVLWMVAPTLSLLRVDEVRRASARVAPLLAAVPRWQRLVELGVEAQGRRHAAVEAVLDRARRELDTREAEAELVAALQVSAEAARLAEVLRREALPALAPGSEYRPRLEGLLPAAPPPAFRQAPLPAPSEATMGAWEELLGFLTGRDRALADGAQALLALRQHARRDP